MKYLFIVLTVASLSYSQVKIDNIELTRKEAKNYFLDCREYPDTVWIFSHQGGYFETEGIKLLEKECAGKTYKMRPQPEDIRKINDDYKKRGIMASISDGSEYVAIGYIVPRKPSATDYANYIRRTQK